MIAAYCPKCNQLKEVVASAAKNTRTIYCLTCGTMWGYDLAKYKTMQPIRLQGNNETHTEVGYFPIQQ